MTGFGAAEGPVAGRALRVEIRGVNHRYFNLSLKAPGELAPLEPELREQLRRQFERGAVTVQLRWNGVEEKVPTPARLNVERAREAMARLKELKEATQVAGDVTLELLARQPDVFVTAEVESTPVSWADVESVVARAIEQCQAMRQREGEVLARELRGRLELIGALADQVTALAPARLIRERDRLRAAVAQLMDGRSVDDARLVQELAFAADRLDITEELVRLRAHLTASSDALAGPRAVGKQLGFLAQELGREVNTIGSKANDAAIQHLVVDMKGELERFREQLENLE
jgi:uncharacterized protein (TIGR00255 family)